MRRDSDIPAVGHLGKVKHIQNAAHTGNVRVQDICGVGRQNRAEVRQATVLFTGYDPHSCCLAQSRQGLDVLAVDRLFKPVRTVFFDLFSHK